MIQRGVGECWEAAVEVTAAAYRVDPALLRAPSRGRGPRPPLLAREPKKVAIFLTVVLADCPYTAVARHLDLHKDTVCSHCEDLRQLAATDMALETQLDALTVLAVARLSVAAPAIQPVAVPEPGELWAQLLALRGEIEGLKRQGGASSDTPRLHPTKTADHADVIELAEKRRAAR